MVTLDLSILTKLKTKKIKRIKLYTLLVKTKIHKKSVNMLKNKYNRCQFKSYSYKRLEYKRIGRT
jgi:hypothetical protein